MKKIIPFLIWILLFTYACAAPGDLITPTIEAVPATADAATATDVQTNVGPPTPIAPEPSPTAEVDVAKYVKYTEKPSGIEGFQEFPSVPEIFTKLYQALDELDRQGKLPKLDPNAPPMVAELVKNSSGVEFKANLVCNKDGSINCITVAYIKVVDDKYVTILKIRNGDGTDGFFPWWNAGYWGQKNINRIIDNIISDPTGFRVIEIEMRSGGPNDDNEVLKKYFEDEDFVNAILEFVDTQIFPKDYRNIVPAGAWD